MLASLAYICAVRIPSEDWLPAFNEAKNRYQKIAVFYLVRREGFEPPKPEAMRLQRISVDRLDTDAVRFAPS